MPLIRIEEFAELAGLTVGTLYQYHCRHLYEFPPADIREGRNLFWKRSTAVAWLRWHERIYR